MTKPLLIASTNPGKLREIEEILSTLFHPNPVPFQLVLPADAAIQLEVVENGQTYAENAALKVQAYCRASGLVTLADDSGLEVDALGGQPGLHSARYAPWEGANDADRRRLLIENLKGFPQPWTAHFHCTVSILAPKGEPVFTEGDVQGEIIAEERGSNGFGYDPIFFLPVLGMTMAQLSSEEKNRISHRALAVQAAVPFLLKMLDEPSE